jgi:hypothetical protein
VSPDDARDALLRDIKALADQAQGILVRIEDFHGENASVDRYRLSLAWAAACQTRAVIASMSEAVKCEMIPQK